MALLTKHEDETTQKPSLPLLMTIQKPPPMWEYSHLYAYKGVVTLLQPSDVRIFDGYASYALLKDMLYQEIQLPANDAPKTDSIPKESPYYKWGGILKSN